MAAKRSPGALAGATGAGKPIYATTDGFSQIARKANARKPGVPYRITPSAGEPFRIVAKGRVRWALDRLRAHGLTEAQANALAVLIWGAG